MRRRPVKITRSRRNQLSPRRPDGGKQRKKKQAPRVPVHRHGPVESADKRVPKGRRGKRAQRGRREAREHGQNDAPAAGGPAGARGDDDAANKRENRRKRGDLPEGGNAR